MIFLSILSKYW